MTNKTIVFTDLDLDGACSYLIHCWYTQSKPKVVPLKVSTLREKFLGWLNNNKLEDFKEVYFFDIDTTEIKDLIDKKNVIVFDHHKTHVDDYKVAEFYIDHDAPSCSKILYRHYNNTSSTNLTVEQKKLIALVNDYDCYDLKFPESNKLNFLFWYKNGDKIQNFVNDFEHGFHGFTNEQNKIISYHIYKFNKLTEELQLFESNVPVSNINYRFVSTFVNTYVNDVAQHIIDKTNCDVCMLINLKNKRVYFRKRRDTKIDLGKLAKKLCEGGGHEYAAGGILNDVILTLSKQFTPING
tara:strand:+ start:1632 stop:2522 length:891 start_codon:yes stop_codon:yes gene_type:complete